MLGDMRQKRGHRAYAITRFGLTPASDARSAIICIVLPILRTEMS